MRYRSVKRDRAAPRPEADVRRRSRLWLCLLYTSDAADERSSVDLGGRRIIKKKNNNYYSGEAVATQYLDLWQRVILLSIRTRRGER